MVRVTGPDGTVYLVPRGWQIVATRNVWVEPDPYV